jgi:hypothetical protein
MLTVKRLYLYGVLGLSLVALLYGLVELSRFVLGLAADALASRPLYGGGVAREQLSTAIALVLVAGPIWAVHLGLVRRSLRGSADQVADERASASRATYFFLVLIGIGVAAAMALFDISHELISSLMQGDRPRGLSTAIGMAVVTLPAWALHVVARRGDLRAAPERTSGDWLTRAYLYGTLWLAAVLGSLAIGTVLSTAARGLLDMQPLWESAGWWREAIVGPLSGVLVAAAIWALHWTFAQHLLSAPDPMGSAQRSSRTRGGYFLAVGLACAAAVLVLGASSLGNAFAELFGTWRPSEGSRLIEDVGGPLIMLLPFLIVGAWHLRRGATEASMFAGPTAARATVRSSRLVVAFVGLAGLSFGLAWELQLLFDSLASSSRSGVLSTAALPDDTAAALGFALVGLLLWLPAWVLSQQERARAVVEVATATSRRAYLFLVSGVSVVVIMGALAFLVFQVTRALLDAGTAGDSSPALAALAMATVVLGYHLYCLRADLFVARAGEEAEGSSDGPELATNVDQRSRETIEISAPAGADFKVLNAAIRTELPDGYELHVVV